MILIEEMTMRQRVCGVVVLAFAQVMRGCSYRSGALM